MPTCCSRAGRGAALLLIDFYRYDKGNPAAGAGRPSGTATEVGDLHRHLRVLGARDHRPASSTCRQAPASSGTPPPPSACCSTSSSTTSSSASASGSRSASPRCSRRNSCSTNIAEDLLMSRPVRRALARGTASVRAPAHRAWRRACWRSLLLSRCSRQFAGRMQRTFTLFLINLDRRARPRRLLRQFRHPQLRPCRLHRYRRLCLGDPHAPARHQGQRAARTCRRCLATIGDGDCRRRFVATLVIVALFARRRRHSRSCAWAAPRR